MAKITVTIGVLLILLGASTYIATGSQHPTAMIPTWFGIALCLCGVFANTDNAKKRMLWMHVAVTLGLLGLVGAAVRLGQGLAEHGKQIDRIAAGSQGAMAVLCGIFVALCVKSFIAARRERTAAVS